MPYKNASFPKEPYLDVNSANKSSLSVSAMVSRLSSRFNIKLGVTTSLLATIHLPSSSQVIYATDLIPIKNTAEHNFFVQKTALASPRVFSVIISPVKSQLINLSKVVLKEDSKSILAKIDKNSEPNFASLHFNTAANSIGMLNTNMNRDFYVATENKLLLSSTLSTAKKTFKTYTVKPGDTVHQIAKQHRVSSSELVRLNKINNSNVIFVNQQLEIPAKAIDNTLLNVNIRVDPPQGRASVNGVNLQRGTIHAQKETILASDNSPQGIKQKSIPSASSNLPTTTEENHPNPSKLDRNKADSVTSTEDPHVVKLRAEIEQMRDRNRDRQRQNQTNNTATSLPSANNSKDNYLREKDRDRSKQIDVVTSATTQDNLKHLLPEETISLQLPPLPPSEEYLPSVFEGYIWPAQGVLTSGYGWRWGRLHRGIDIAAPVGTPVLAAASGKVINAGWHSGYGNLIKLEHLDGSISLYAHNHRNLVSHGQSVKQGEQIAEMGNTGYSTGSHLHFEIHFKDGGAVDPMALLGSK